MSTCTAGYSFKTFALLLFICLFPTETKKTKIVFWFNKLGSMQQKPSRFASKASYELSLCALFGIVSAGPTIPAFRGDAVHRVYRLLKLSKRMPSTTLTQRFSSVLMLCQISVPMASDGKTLLPKEASSTVEVRRNSQTAFCWVTLVTRV